MNYDYTFGVKGATGDRVYLYNLTKPEAERIVAADPQVFKLAWISTSRCPKREAYDRDAQHAKDIARCSPISPDEGVPPCDTLS
jgi:hypothetical protein